MYQNGSSAFLLYSLSTDQKKLSVNAVPPGTASVPLCLYPGDNGGRMTLTASRTESIDKVWLEDLLTHTIVNLKEEDSYTFTASPQDTPERFVVHFSNAPLGLEPVADSFLQCYYHQDELVVKGLRKEDINSSLFIVDMQGRILQKTAITQTPEIHIPFRLSEGVYLARLQGSRSITVKFQKGGEGK
jgi:hypothetical protein